MDIKDRIVIKAMIFMLVLAMVSSLQDHFWNIYTGPHFRTYWYNGCESYEKLIPGQENESSLYKRWVTQHYTYPDFGGNQGWVYTMKNKSFTCDEIIKCSDPDFQCTNYGEYECFKKLGMSGCEYHSMSCYLGWRFVIWGVTIGSGIVFILV